MSDEQLRVADSERDAVVAQLREHAAQGRLSLEEFDERVAAALQAVTRGDLRAVLHDLPSDGPTFDEPEPAGPLRPAWMRVVPLTLGIVVLGIVALVSLQMSLWWVIPVFFWTGGFGLWGRRDGSRGWGMCGGGGAWHSGTSDADPAVSERELTRV